MYLYIYVDIFISLHVCIQVYYTGVYTTHTESICEISYSAMKFCQELECLWVRLSVVSNDISKGGVCEARSELRAPSWLALKTELGICPGEAALHFFTLLWSMGKAWVENIKPFMRAAGKLSWMPQWISEIWRLKQRESWWGLAGWKFVINIVNNKKPLMFWSGTHQILEKNWIISPSQLEKNN